MRGGLSSPFLPFLPERNEFSAMAASCFEETSPVTLPAEKDWLLGLRLGIEEELLEFDDVLVCSFFAFLFTPPLLAESFENVAFFVVLESSSLGILLFLESSFLGIVT
jgi:hypothetical protein